MLCAAFRIVFVNAVKGLDFYLVVCEHKSDETTFEFLEPLIVLNRFKAVGFSTFLFTLAVGFPHIFIVCFNEIGRRYQLRGMGIPMGEISARIRLLFGRCHTEDGDQDNDRCSGGKTGRDL